MDHFWYQTEDSNRNDGTQEDVKPNLQLIEVKVNQLFDKNTEICVLLENPNRKTFV